MSVVSSVRVSLKVAAASTCVLSVGVMLKNYPLASSHVASCWNVMLQWLQPLYLYLLINAIIISIVASSKLQLKDNHDPTPFSQISVPPPLEEKVILPIEVSVFSDTSNNDNENNNKVTGDEMMDGGGCYGLEKPPPKKENQDKPPVSARFGHRKAVKSIHEGGGKALRVTKSKRNETLESTWKTITEGRAMPLTRHLKKSDTWDSHVPAPAPKVMKAETFPERSNSNNDDDDDDDDDDANANTVGRLKREPSPSHDELNRRVEAFIKKFNEEMRLQRQRSLEQYNQIINLGAY